MRIRNTLKNSIYSLLSFCFTAGLTFLVRKVFLNTLSVGLLGYEGLFSNVFSILSLANLGINSIILYRLFPAFVKHDNEMISYLMSIYRVLYRCVGLAILLIGIALVPFFHLIVKEENVQWNYVYIIYFIQLGGTLCTYFLAYKRIVFSVNQQEYECTKTDSVISLIENLIRILVLLTLRSYILYLLCGLTGTILGNVIISRKVRRNFPSISFNKKIAIKDIRSLNILNEIKHNFIQQICFVIYGGTDGILITYLFGIEQTGLIENYYLIQTYVTKVITKLLFPFQMSIGNYIYSDNTDNGDRLFRMFDFVSYLIASIVFTSYISLFNPTISFLFGERYLLPFEFVLAFSINQYIATNHHFVTYYRLSFGKYELDTFPIVLAAVFNILFSIVLGKRIGIAGVMIGTAIGHLGIWYGRVRVVYHEYMKEKVSKYVTRQVIRICCCSLQAFLAFMLCKDIQVNLLGIIIRILICALISIAINFMVFFHSEEVKGFFIYIGRIKEELRRRVHSPE